MDEKYPARLHVLLARERKYGVVIRRVPSKQTCFFGWDRQKNTFELSQWLKGRVDEQQSDLSPNGQYLIYFVMSSQKFRSETEGTWTAISKAPWMKAIALFGKGDHWHGGGLFLSNNTYWLNDGFGHKILQQTDEVKRNLSYMSWQDYDGQWRGIYFFKLQRDGWLLKKLVDKSEFTSEFHFEKTIAEKWILRKICHNGIRIRKGKGCS